LCKGHSHYLKNCPYTKTAVQAASEKRKAETSSRQLSNKVESKISQLEKTIKSLAKELKEVKSKQKLKKAYTSIAVESESSNNKNKH
jgi:exonuclease VII large subunit